MGLASAAVSWLHLLAAVIWLGGMAFSFLVVMPSLAAIDSPPLRGKLMGAVVKRFAPIAWTAVAILVLTGLAMTAWRVPSLAVLVSTSYGIKLLVKILIAVVMIAIGAEVAFVLTPKLEAMSAPAPVAVPDRQPPTVGGPSAPPPKVARVQGQITTLGKMNLGLGMLMLVFAVAMRWL
jgi:copper resistance protein D